MVGEAGRLVRVLHVEYGMGFGGALVSLGALLDGFRRVGGVESTVLTFLPREITAGHFGETRTVRVRVLLSYRARALLLGALDRPFIPRLFRRVLVKAYAVADYLHDYYLGYRISRLVRRHRIDIVHANNSWKLSAVRGAAWGGAACIVHFRSFPPSRPTTLLERYGPVADRVVTACLGISEAVSRSVARFGVPVERVRTVPNPVIPPDDAQLTRWRSEVRTKLGLMPEQVVVAVFGRITAWKGQVEFLEAMAPVVRVNPNLVMMIVGDESDAADAFYRQRLHLVADTPPLAGRVLLTGYQRDVFAYYAAADIVVHCSVEPEPFGRVVIEAMAAGRPIVAMAEGGPAEIVTDEVDGLLVAPRNPVALAAAVSRLAEDARLRQDLGARGRATVRAKYLPEAIAQEVRECYLASVMGRAGARQQRAERSSASG